MGRYRLRGEENVIKNIMKKSANPITGHPTTEESTGKAPEQYSPSDCDDCAICRSMRKAEEEGRDLSFEELQELFRKQNTQN